MILKKIRFNIDVILPIALALFLPGLNLFSNAVIKEEYTLDFYKKWLYASVVLYVLWHTLHWFSKFKIKYKFLLIAATVLLSIILAYLFFMLTTFKEYDHIKWLFFIKLISASVLFLTIQYSLNAEKNIAALKIEKEKIQTENYKVQLESLRSKIDPHFMFNSLNTLRTMVRHQDLKAEQFILSLSDFYRQTLQYNEATIIN